MMIHLGPTVEAKQVEEGKLKPVNDDRDRFEEGGTGGSSSSTAEQSYPPVYATPAKQPHRAQHERLKKAQDQMGHGTKFHRRGVFLKI